MAENPGVDEWTDHTTNEERVRVVALAVQSPRSSAWTASEAAVDEDTTRDLLDRFVEAGVLTETRCDELVKYAPDRWHARRKTLQDPLAEHDEADLKRLKQELENEAEKSDDPPESGLIDYRLTLVRDAIDLRHIYG